MKAKRSKKVRSSKNFKLERKALVLHGTAPFLKRGHRKKFLGTRPLKCLQVTRASEDEILWKDREGSSNVEDRRGEGGGFGGGGPRFPLPRGKMGLAVLAVVLVAGYYGIDLTPLLGLDSPMAPTQTSSSYQPSAQEQELAKFSSVALRTTEETWDRIFAQSGKRYIPPKMVLYSGSTRTACGYGQAAMGPFYSRQTISFM